MDNPQGPGDPFSSHRGQAGQGVRWGVYFLPLQQSPSLTPLSFLPQTLGSWSRVSVVSFQGCKAMGHPGLRHGHLGALVPTAELHTHLLPSS